MALTWRGAVVRGIAASLPANALRQEEAASPIDLDRARAEHAAYVRVLRGVVTEVIEVPADEAHPDCVFIEDTCVVVEGVALITRPGHPSRRGEVAPVADALAGAGVRTVPIESLAGVAADATIDGGDVLWTGHEFFVGLTSRTNDGGADALQAAFPGRRVVRVRPGQGLHLKSLCSLAAPDVIAVGATPGGERVRAAIEAASPGRYRFLTVATDAEANCVLVNGTVLHLPSASAAYATLGLPTLAVSNSELSKCDGALTCCSVLF